MGDKIFQGDEGWQLRYEVWKDIRDFEGVYQVSNKGRVRSLDRTIEQVNGVTRRVRGQIISPMKGAAGDRGYCLVHLHVENRLYPHYVHQLVAAAFGKKPKHSGQVLMHVNGDLTDNRPGNLKWVDQSVTTPRCEAHGRAKLTPMDIRTIRNSPHGPTTLARWFFVSRTQIQRIRRGDHW